MIDSVARRSITPDTARQGAQRPDLRIGSEGGPCLGPNACSFWSHWAFQSVLRPGTVSTCRALTIANAANLLLADRESANTPADSSGHRINATCDQPSSERVQIGAMWKDRTGSGSRLDGNCDDNQLPISRPAALGYTQATSANYAFGGDRWWAYTQSRLRR